MRVDVDVTDLAGEAVRAGIELVAEHQAAADAGAERHHQEARVLAAVTVELLAQGRGRGVVFHRDRAAQAPCELLPDVHVLEPGNVGEPPAATVRVDLTGIATPTASGREARASAALAIVSSTCSAVDPALVAVVASLSTSPPSTMPARM